MNVTLRAVLFCLLCSPVARAANTPVALTPVASKNPAVPTLQGLFNARELARAGVFSAPDRLALSPSQRVLVIAGKTLFDVPGKRALAQVPDLSDAQFSGSGALLVISGTSLGTLESGVFRAKMELPATSMRLAPLGEGAVVFGGNQKALYLIDPARGVTKLLELPEPVGAASGVGSTLFFSVANDLFRLELGGNLELVCRIPGPVFDSLAASSPESCYLTAGNSVYSWQPNSIRLLGEGLGDQLAFLAPRSLLVLNTNARTLVRITP